jgi:hypothetical protein
MKSRCVVRLLSRSCGRWESGWKIDAGRWKRKEDS